MGHTRGIFRVNQLCDPVGKPIANVANYVGTWSTSDEVSVLLFHSVVCCEQFLLTLCIYDLLAYLPAFLAAAHTAMLISFKESMKSVCLNESRQQRVLL